MGGRSSADPDDLDAWVGASRQLDEVLRLRQAALARLHDEFTATSRWGFFDASSLIGAFRAYIGWNEIDAAWVAQIAAAFRRADSDGGVVSLPDAAIQAALRAAGLAGARQSVTFDDPIAFGEPPTSGYANDPVNTASGNFVEVEGDLAFGGLLRGLGFARTFNSRSDRVGPFGPGWASWASCRLQATPEGALWESPDGQRATIPTGDGGYQRVAGIAGLVVGGEVGLALEWFDGGRWEFDADGLPLRADDGPGTRVRFTHVDGRLVEMAHEAGKRLEFEWEGERITGLACSDGRRVDYRYDEAANLVEVDAPQGLRRYEVDGAGRVLAVVDADGVVEARNTYDAQGRVIAQESPHGRRSRLRYLAGGVTIVDDDAGGPTNTYLHDDHGRLVGVVDGHGAELAKVYDDWGNPVAVTDRKGAVTLQGWDERSRLVRQVLPSGAEFTFSYDHSDRVVEVATSTGGAGDGDAPVAAVTRYRYRGDERTPTEIVDPEGGITRLEVEGGLVRRVVDPDGVTLAFAFDGDGNLVSTTDADGNTAVLERDAAGRVLAAVSPAGRRTELCYDDRGRLVERRDPDGATWRFDYTPAGRLAATLDPTGARSEARHGSNGEVEALVDPFGYVTSRRFDALGNLAGVVMADGAKWEFNYDALCRLVAIHDPAGASWLRDYDADGNLTASVDPLGVRRTATVDKLGRITALHDGITSVAFDFDALGRATVHRRPDGTALGASYDRCGRRTSVRDPIGGVTRYHYTPGGRLARVTSPLGSTTGFDYDRCGRLVAEVDALEQRRSYRYDPDGQLTALIEPTGETWRFRYDQAGRLASRRRPGGGTTRYAYDPAGRLTQVTDPAGGVARFRYDLRGQLVEAVDPTGGVTRYAYNERGWLTTTTDPLGGTIRRRYDEAGRVVALIDQLGRTTRWEYDPAGRLVRHIDPTGRQVRWRHDQSGRISGYAAEGSEVAVERDLLGRPVSVDEPGLHHQLRWDPLGRLVEKRRGDLGLSWRYDGDGRQTAIGYPDGSQTTFAYDPAGRAVSATHPALGTVQLRHDPAGRLLGMSGPGISRRWDYRDGELVGFESEVGGHRRARELTRDVAGRVVAETRDGQTRRYRYDPAGQLVAVGASDGDWSFAYDAAGRLAAETGPDGEIAYTYDAAHQLLERRHRDTVTHFAYDAAGRRVSETAPDHARTYTWDPLGRLSGIERHTPSKPSTTTPVKVDALGDLAAVDDTPLLWDPTGVVAQLRWMGDTAIIGGDDPWATLDPTGGARWLEADWQGSIGNPARDPWGADGTAGPGQGPRLAWRGEVEVDGLVWLRHRTYDPAIRSFLSTDPLPGVPGTASAANPYHYANNDPLGWVDPLGLRPLTDADLRAYKQAAGRNLLERGAHWAQDNWEYIAAGAAVVAGAALIATGVGSPLGAVLIGGALIGGGTSAGLQRLTTGEVDWGRVAIDAAIGGAAGGIGVGAAAATRLGSPLLRGAVAGAAENVTAGAATRAAYGENPFNPPALGKDLLLGGGTGALGGRLGAEAAPRAVPDFVAGPPGSHPPVPTSQRRMAAGFDRAGFPNQPTRSSGIQYTLPDASKVRLMEPTAHAPRRASFTDLQGNPINPFTGKPVPPPPGLDRAERLAYIRARTHVEQYP